MNERFLSVVLPCLLLAAMGPSATSSGCDCGGSPQKIKPDSGPDPELCGNGVLDPLEVCDDGNTTSGDGCSATCQSESCDQQTCPSGCCSALGDCLSGTQDSACGTGGLSCLDCTELSLLCTAHQCQPPGNCTPQDTQSCGDCGLRTCDAGGHWGTCQGPTPPLTESCSTGLPGVCDAGTRTCESDGMWEQCIPDIQPGSQTETCNGVDDDCNGAVDDGCDDCFHWSGTPSLSQALNSHDCVEIQSGTFDLGSTVYVPANRELRGLGHSQSILTPSASFSDTALIVVNQSHVLLRRFRVRGDVGSGAVLNIVVLGAGTTNVVMDELLIDGAKCDGLSMGGEGTVIQYSILRNNGYDCPPIYTGSAIYAEGNVTIPGSQYAHALQIINNLIEDNPFGSGIDLAEVSDGYIAQNTIQNNGANGGISLYHSYGFIIEYNDISNSGGWFNYGHPSCEGSHSPATIGIKLCRDADIFGGTDNNIIRYNTSVGYYGILLAGDDETTPYLVPRFNEIYDNDVTGSTVGCLDDFQPGQWTNGDNIWTNNNCQGTPNTPPDYF